MFLIGLWFATLLGIVTLVTLLLDTLIKGRSKMNLNLLTGFPGRSGWS
jgi:hypothetical protein